MKQEKKNALGYSVFWLLDQTPQSNMVIMKTFCNTDSIVFQRLNVRSGWKRYCAKALTTVILESALSDITKAVLLNKAVFLFYLHGLMLPRQNFY